MDREMDVALERGPIHLTVLDVIPDVDRAEVADVVRQKRLLSARIGRLVVTDVWNGVEAVGFIDEEATGLAGAPRAVDHLVPHSACIELTSDGSAARIDEIVRRT